MQSYPKYFAERSNHWLVVQMYEGAQPFDVKFAINKSLSEKTLQRRRNPYKENCEQNIYLLFLFQARCVISKFTLVTKSGAETEYDYKKLLLVMVEYLWPVVFPWKPWEWFYG